MKIIRPVMITPDVLKASSVSADEHGEWDDSTSYEIGARVIVAEGRRVYESLVDDNVGNDPLEPGDPPAWLDVGPANRWAMFEDPVAQATVAPEQISVTLDPGRVDALALLNIQANQVEIELHDPEEGLVHQRAINLLDNLAVTDWYAYFFEPIVRKTDLNLFDLPPYGFAELTVRLAGEGDVAVGLLVVGLQKLLGHTQYGAQFSIIDYSRKERDEFGRPKLVRRNYSKRALCNIWVENTRIEDVYHTLSGYRTVPLVWSTANGMYEGVALIYGFYRDFTKTIQYPRESVCLLEIEGLT